MLGELVPKVQGARGVLLQLEPTFAGPEFYDEWRRALEELESVATTLALVDEPTVELDLDVARRLVDLLSSVPIPAELRPPPNWMQQWHLPAYASPAWNLVLRVRTVDAGAGLMLELVTVDGQPLWRQVLQFDR
ncbi:MAG: hypothetical protein QOG30_1863 [Acidimicrobiaceae bacterium]|jgi:hypothetical protein